MIQMGLLNMLINRLEISIKDLKETHNIDHHKKEEKTRPREMDDELDIIFPKRVKMEFTPPRLLPVSCNTCIMSKSMFCHPIK